MIKNYIKIAWRNILKNRSFSLINVMGLALGMACAIVIFTLVKYHLSFDNFHADADRIYRIVTEKHRDVVAYDASVPNGLGKAFKNDYTFGEKVARVWRTDNELISIQQQQEIKKFREIEGVSFVETDYFDIFNFPLLEGDKTTALREPNTAILTKRMAQKYFGNDNAIGKTIKIDNISDVTITGILQDLPVNTYCQTEIFISYPTLVSFDTTYSDDAWGGINGEMQCFVKLRPNISVAEVEKIFPAYVQKFRPKSKNVHHYKLQPLDDIHFDARYGGVMEKKTLWVLSLIGLFLIITACVNFVNLATAQALNRSKEIGVRKVLGSLKGQLFWQFMSETALITFVSSCVAVVLAQLVFPFVSQLFHIPITLNVLSDGQLMLFIPLLIAVVTFIAGAYPGFILAGFQPIAALKGKISQQNIGGFNTRRSLIVTQFAISQALIIGMIVIASQMRFAQKADLGFDKEAIVMVPVGSQDGKRETLKKQLQQIRGVENVSLCLVPPYSEDNSGTDMRLEANTETENFRFINKAGDADYLNTFGLKLVAGRNLFPSDSVREYVVNETLAKKLNFKSPEELIGKMITVYRVKAPIVGVVKDFHDETLRSDIHPIFISNNPEALSSYAVKINLNNTKTTLSAIEKTWSNMYPERLYEFQFLDEQIAQFYETEQTLLTLIQAFSVIAIFISCLGLFGLMRFMAMQKTKEIGIRKVLGSSVGQIVWIFGKEFSKLIVIAFLIATPIAWYFMNSWLQDFKFRISIGASIFLLAMASTFLITFLTVGYQAIKAAVANPVKSLRTE
jgi:putative ABC transport system permease protein